MKKHLAEAVTSVIVTVGSHASNAQSPAELGFTVIVTSPGYAGG